MKQIIQDNERGFLYKNGVYQRMLTPGRHRIWPVFGESCTVVTADGCLDAAGMHLNLPVLLKDAVFAESVTIMEVPDDRLAVYFVNGRVAGALKPGRYVFWNVMREYTYEIIDVTEPESAAQVPFSYRSFIPSQYYIKLDVNDGETSLLFYNGVFQKLLGAGQYYYWVYNTKVHAQTVDTRVQPLDILGQEILTADKVSLRLNFVCAYEIADPVCIVTRLKDYKTQLHVLVQLVLREFTGKYRFDELLRQKDSIGGFILEKLRERENEFYVKFHDAGVKDIILPGEIRDIMNTVLVAEKSAQASVIMRREETAATKSLLDTARMMDENATLYRLKELEYLERICEKIGSISVDAGGGILKNLRELTAGKP